MVSAPAPPEIILSDTSPVSMSSKSEPIRFSIAVKVSPSASPVFAVRPLRSAVTPSRAYSYEAASSPSPPSSLSSPKPPTRILFSSFPVSSSL